MIRLMFICVGTDDAFDPKDISILLNQQTDWWQNFSADECAEGVQPIHVEGEQSQLFGFLPGALVTKYPELYDGLKVEFAMHVDDLDYQPKVDPILGVQVEVYDGGFLED